MAEGPQPSVDVSLQRPEALQPAADVAEGRPSLGAHSSAPQPSTPAEGRPSLAPSLGFSRSTNDMASLRESRTALLAPTPRMSVNSRSALDGRLTQSWHSGARRLEVIPPHRRSRSFDGVDMHDEEWNASRTFGGIERLPRLTAPTAEQVEGFTSFCRQYESWYHRKPHVIAFVNSRSGGQTGGLLMETLIETMGTQADGAENCTGQVCDLSSQEEPQNTLDRIAKTLDPRIPLKLLVCGGDGTVTWILTAMEQTPGLKGKLHLLPVAIVPLGTGNDLARSLGWGGKMRAVGDIIEYLRLVIEAEPVELDQWRVLLRPHESLPEDHKLRSPGSHPQLIRDLSVRAQCHDDIQEALGEDYTAPNSEDVYIGAWQNYFSIGLDAKVAFYVDQSRSTTGCGRGCFRRGCGKFCYAWQGILRSCCNYLLARSIGLVRTVPAKSDTEEMVDMDPPLQDVRADCARGRLRQLMLVNINSYGAGLDVMPRVLDPKPAPADGVLEVMGVRNAAFSLGLFARLKRPAYIASTKALAFRLSAGEYMQLDGEPWLLESGCDVLVDPHRKLTMLRAPPQGRFWRGHVTPTFWALRTASEPKPPALIEPRPFSA